jgi:hypothetical protein
MATVHALPDVPLSERLAHERRLRQRLHALEAVGWDRLAPLAQHMIDKRLVRARGDAGAPVRHLGLEVLRAALCRLLSQDDGAGDGDLIFRLVVEGADPADIAAERGISRPVLVEQLRDAMGDLAVQYEHAAYAGVVETEQDRVLALLRGKRG